MNCNELQPSPAAFLRNGTTFSGSPFSSSRRRRRGARHCSSNLLHPNGKPSSVRINRAIDVRTEKRTDIGMPRHPRQALVEDASCDSFGHMQRGAENPLTRRIDELGGEVFVADLFGDGFAAVRNISSVTRSASVAKSAVAMAGKP
jgi:hypothetical protein